MAEKTCYLLASHNSSSNYGVIASDEYSYKLYPYDGATVYSTYTLKFEVNYFWQNGSWKISKGYLYAKRTDLSAYYINYTGIGFGVIPYITAGGDGWDSSPEKYISWYKGTDLTTTPVHWVKYSELSTEYQLVATVFYSGSITPGYNNTIPSGMYLKSNFGIWQKLRTSSSSTEMEWRYVDVFNQQCNLKSKDTLAIEWYYITTEDWEISSEGLMKCYYGGNITMPTFSKKNYVDTKDPYTITWDANGGTGGSTSESTKKSISYSYTNFIWDSSISSVSDQNSGATVTYVTTPGVIFSPTCDNAPGYPITTSATVSAIAASPTRRGYKFQNWYTAKSGGEVVTAGRVISGNTTFYAHWEARTYSVNYSLSGEGAYYVNSEKPSAISKKQFGSPVSITTIIPKRKGYTFVGWHTNKDISPTSTTIIYPTDSSNEVGTKLDNLWDDSTDGITIYSIWTPTVHNVEYHYYLTDEGSEEVDNKNHNISDCQFTIETESYEYYEPIQKRSGDWVLFGWTDDEPDYWGKPSAATNPEWAYGTFKNPDEAPENIKPFTLTEKIKSMTEEEWEDTTPIKVYGFWTVTGKYIKITNTGNDSVDWKKISVAYYKAEDEKWHVINSLGFKDSNNEWHPEVGREF